MGWFNIHTFLAEELAHLEDHRLHCHNEAHLVDLHSLHQTFHCYLHPVEACDHDELEIHVTVPWSSDTQRDWREWNATCDRDELLPKKFRLELNSEFCLPLLDNPPEMLNVWMAVLSEFDQSSLSVQITASDLIESPTDRARRNLQVMAHASVPLQQIVEAAHQDTGEQPPMCVVWDDLHRLSIHLLERLPLWCSRE